MGFNALIASSMPVETRPRMANGNHIFEAHCGLIVHERSKIKTVTISNTWCGASISRGRPFSPVERDSEL